MDTSVKQVFVREGDDVLGSTLVEELWGRGAKTTFRISSPSTGPRPAERLPGSGDTVGFCGGAALSSNPAISCFSRVGSSNPRLVGRLLSCCPSLSEAYIGRADRRKVRKVGSTRSVTPTLTLRVACCAAHIPSAEPNIGNMVEMHTSPFFE